MNTARRIDVYARARGLDLLNGSGNLLRLTARQRRRVRHKANRDAHAGKIAVVRAAKAEERRVGRLRAAWRRRGRGA